MTDAFLPEIKQETAIVAKNTGRATPQFLRFFNVNFRGAIKSLFDGQASQISSLQEIVDALQGATQVAQAAQAAANDAQTTADDALGMGTVAGSATDPSITLLDAAWVPGPQVDLTGVVGGNLTITGSGPQQDDNVSVQGLPGPGGSLVYSALIEWRVVEIDGFTETVLFTGNAKASGPGVATVTNLSTDAASAFVSARSSTGAISYRIDARATSGAASDLLLYIYARRAA